MQVRIVAARAERARDEAERLRIAEAQAAERARGDAQLAAERARLSEIRLRQHALERSRCAARAAKAAAKAAAADRRESDTKAWAAAERAVEARYASAFCRSTSFKISMK